MAHSRDDARPRRVRIRDVAAMAKVSTMTVARVLRQSDKVARETRRRVEAVLRRTGYTPDLVARSLAISRTGVVAVLVPHLGHSSFTDTIQGMSDALDEDGTRILVGATGFAPEKEEALVRAFLSRRVDAMFLTGTTHSQGTVKALAAARIPVVEGNNIPQRPIDLVVGFSNEAAARAATDHLIARGYRAIAYIGLHERNNDRMRDRHRGYLAALEAAGLRARAAWSIASDLKIDAGAAAMVRLLASDPRPRAVFCASDVLAMGALQECGRRGIRVPQDVAIAGFDDLELASQLAPPLTTIRVPRYQIGWNAGLLIRDSLAGRRIARRVLDLGFELVRRGST